MWDGDREWFGTDDQGDVELSIRLQTVEVTSGKRERPVFVQEADVPPLAVFPRTTNLGLHNTPQPTPQCFVSFVTKRSLSTCPDSGRGTTDVPYRLGSGVSGSATRTLGCRGDGDPCLCVVETGKSPLNRESDSNLGVLDLPAGPPINLVLEFE